MASVEEHYLKIADDPRCRRPVLAGMDGLEHQRHLAHLGVGHMAEGIAVDNVHSLSQIGG